MLRGPNAWSSGDLYNFGMFLMYFFCVSLSLSVHEFSHAYAAYKLGDSTAKLENRLTLSPFSHLDIGGLISLFLFRYGWARPVPINPLNFRKNIRKSIAIVSLAGPCANLVLAFVSIFFFKIINLIILSDISLINKKILFIIQRILTELSRMNVNLAVFNMIPIPPLDGSKVLTVLLPLRSQRRLVFLAKYGSMILFLLLQFAPFVELLNFLSNVTHNLISRDLLPF